MLQRIRFQDYQMAAYRGIDESSALNMDQKTLARTEILTNKDEE